MTGKEKILGFAQKKKTFRAIEAERELNLPRTYLSRLVEEGLLEKVGYGLYSLADSDIHGMQSWVEVAVKAPKGVLCLLSALAFHELTTQNPFEVWLAVPRDAHRPKIEFVQTRVFRFAPTVYEAGIETHVINGVEVKVYSAAKTVADCFYYRNTVGLDVAIEALRDAFYRRKATIDEMYRFAEIRNVKGAMYPHLYALSV
ncbi:MAG: type IV toxin-antitoxin system AbiEi family antitoxin domain-containing protein [Acidobacteriota bacterium]|nr:type IV toxin-antitoxin system AbiEi family antitoxin domain-containing protein [Acidobacteriota bacterium]